MYLGVEFHAWHEQLYLIIIMWMNEESLFEVFEDLIVQIKSCKNTLSIY